MSGSSQRDRHLTMALSDMPSRLQVRQWCLAEAVAMIYRFHLGHRPYHPEGAALDADALARIYEESSDRVTGYFEILEIDAAARVLRDVSGIEITLDADFDGRLIEAAVKEYLRVWNDSTPGLQMEIAYTYTPQESGADPTLA